jgi:hypothetical protein
VAVRGPTDLALQFNLRHRGQPVSTQAVHKWLSGKALPTRDKVETLSEWLRVQECWLLFGVNPGDNGSDDEGPDQLQPEVSRLMANIWKLTSRQRALLEALIGEFQGDAVNHKIE